MMRLGRSCAGTPAYGSYGPERWVTLYSVCGTSVISSSQVVIDTMPVQWGSPGAVSTDVRETHLGQCCHIAEAWAKNVPHRPRDPDLPSGAGADLSKDTRVARIDNAPAVGRSSSEPARRRP